MIVNDITNARFLWKRIPKSIKDVEAASTNSQILGEIWGIGKSITLKEFGKAFVQSRTLLAQLESDSEKNSFATTAALLKILEKT